MVNKTKNIVSFKTNLGCVLGGTGIIGALVFLKVSHKL